MRVPPFDLPINLGLNDGTYCPQACVDVLAQFNERTSLRNYVSADNQPFREAVAARDGVGPEHVYPANGSGPILKQVVPWVIRLQIKRSPTRIAKHFLANKTGYPIITPRFTYFKVPLKGAKVGLGIKLLPMGPENDFQLDVDTLRATLERTDGVVYLANPNNPTGRVLITREQLVPLLEAHPNSIFWIDEAYVQYIPEDQHAPLTDLVPRYDNLMVSRTFSFAYGMAAARIGYLVAQPQRVLDLEGQVTSYRLGDLQERLALAALADTEHLPFVRAQCAEGRRVLCDALNAFDFVETFDSQCNFFLARFTDGRSAKPFAEELDRRGVHIKTFEPVKTTTYEPYFRITVGVPEENAFLAELMTEILQA